MPPNKIFKQLMLEMWCTLATKYSLLGNAEVHAKGRISLGNIREFKFFENEMQKEKMQAAITHIIISMSSILGKLKQIFILSSEVKNCIL